MRSGQREALAWDRQGYVAFLTPGVPVRLESIRPEFRCEGAETLAVRLQKRRRLLGLTIERAAALVRVRPATFRGWEKGRVDPSPRFLDALETFLGVV